MTTQATMIKVQQGTIKLPDDWAQDINNQEVFDKYTDQDIVKWQKEDTLDKQTQDKLDHILTQH
jgi:hypothetical protein